MQVLLTHVKSDAKIDGSNDRIDSSIDRINCYSSTRYLVSTMVVCILMPWLNPLVGLLNAWRSRGARARVFVNFYHKFNTIEKNSTVSDREFDSLANNVEFFGLRIFI